MFVRCEQCGVCAVCPRWLSVRSISPNGPVLLAKIPRHTLLPLLSPPLHALACFFVFVCAPLFPLPPPPCLPLPRRGLSYLLLFASSDVIQASPAVRGIILGGVCWLDLRIFFFSDLVIYTVFPFFRRPFPIRSYVSTHTLLPSRACISASFLLTALFPLETRGKTRVDV